MGQQYKARCKVTGTEEAVLSGIVVSDHEEMGMANPKTFGLPGTLICNELIECTRAWKGVGQKFYMSWNKNAKLKKGGEEGI